MSDGRKRGPKRKDGAQLEPLTIRMDAKLKFGLELLARHQGRSLSQATEWALQHALTTVHVGTRRNTLWQVLSIAWECEGWQRWFTLFEFDPTLVPFDERHACTLIANSPEMAFFAERASVGSISEWTDRRQKWDRIVQVYWSLLLEDATLRMYGNDGKRPLLVEISAVDDQEAESGIPSIIEKAFSELPPAE